MKNTLLLLLNILMISAVFAQESETKKSNFGIKFSGYVKTDFYFDSRKVVAAREDHFLLRPADRLLDAQGNDINDQSSFNILSVQSRLKGSISGPDAFGAKTSGVIEADFFGNANSNINMLRLRHAFIKLNWEHSELLLGQYWNPMFQTDCYPTTLSFNSGAGIMPFARNPQLRYTYKSGGFKFIATAFTERDYRSNGIDCSTSECLRNSGIPALNGQIHYMYKNDNVTLITGLGAGYMNIIPQLVTSANIKTDESLNSTNAMAFITAKFKPITFKFSAVYGENMSNVLYFGGYAVKEVLNNITEEVSYTPIVNNAYWFDVSTHGDKVQFGLFAGINSNMGAKDEIVPSLLAVTNVKNTSRISPRILFIQGKMKFGAELEISSAKFGDGTIDPKGKPLNTYKVTNNRMLFSAIYAF